jgi:hypothetical protein
LVGCLLDFRSVSIGERRGLVLLVERLVMGDEVVESLLGSSLGQHGRRCGGCSGGRGLVEESIMLMVVVLV